VGELWQIRFFDRALRTVKEHLDKAEYIHLNPVRRGWVKWAEDWNWSSVQRRVRWSEGRGTRSAVRPAD